MASLAHHDRVVAADLHVAKGGGRGHDLCAARWWWQWGLARLKGWDMGVGIMWWRGRLSHYKGYYPWKKWSQQT